MATTLHYKWREETIAQWFRTGVSLHGHTMNSHESLGFFPALMEKVTPFAALLDRAKNRYKKNYGAEIDFRKSYWTSPVSPAAAFALEAKQLQDEGFEPLVSLTDHNEIAAPEALAAAHGASAPISLEWTAPYGRAVFHIGVHNLPRAHARTISEELRAYSAKPHPRALTDILHRLNQDPTTLLVLNHPLSDQGQIGHEIHASVVKRFLKEHGHSIHALELNAFQRWEMNQRVVAIADKTGHPLVAGGDRHAFEPSGIVNLTNVRTFDEFVREIREKKQSDVLLLSQCRESIVVRYAKSVSELLADHENLPGRVHWHDRVFCAMPDGTTRSIAELAPPGSPLLAKVNRYLKVLGFVKDTIVLPISPFFAFTKEATITPPATSLEFLRTLMRSEAKDI